MDATSVMPMGADPEKMAMAEAALQGDMMNDVEALIRQARASMENLETEHAYVFSRRALTLKPDHVEAIDIFALANTELGQLDEARDLWLQSVKLAPDQGYEKYLCLGQLSVEHEALDYYEQALERMRQHLTTLPLESDEAKMVASQMASALVSMTEIYLTDCCFEPDAEQKCEAYLEQALKIDPNSVEAYQTLASVRLSQQRPDDAKQALEKSIELWSHLDASDPTFPSIPTRISLVRLLIELEMFDRANMVLEGLVNEDDQLVEVWYLLGWNAYCKGDINQDQRMELWSEAREYLIRARMLIYDDFEDDGIREHVQELISTLNETLPPLEDQSESEEDEGLDDEAEWEDIPSTDDEAMEL